MFVLRKSKLTWLQDTFYFPLDFKLLISEATFWQCSVFTTRGLYGPAATEQ